MKVYIQSVVGQPCDVHGDVAGAIGEVRNLMTDEVVTTLCEECLLREGWVK